MNLLLKKKCNYCFKDIFFSICFYLLQQLYPMLFDIPIFFLIYTGIIMSAIIKKTMLVCVRFIFQTEQDILENLQWITIMNCVKKKKKSMDRLPWRLIRHFSSMAKGAQIKNKGVTRQRREKGDPSFFKSLALLTSRM